MIRSLPEGIKFFEDSLDKRLEFILSIVIIISLEIELDSLLILKAKDFLDIQTIQHSIQLD